MPSKSKTTGFLRSTWDGLREDFRVEPHQAVVGVLVGATYMLGTLFLVDSLSTLAKLGGFLVSVLLAALVSLALSGTSSAKRKALEELEAVHESLKETMLSLATDITHCSIAAPVVLGTITPEVMAPSAKICEGFREIAGESKNLTPLRVRSIMGSFLRESLEAIVDRGFVITDADFSAYRQKSNAVVEALYSSPDEGWIWMNCLYSPLQYLLMLAYGAPEGSTGKPDHLRVFNGIGRNGRLMENSETTHRARVIYVPLEEAREALKRKTYAAVSRDAEFDDAEHAMAYAFSYLWFILTSYRIEHIWRLRASYAHDLKIEKPKDQVDFLIINKEYYWIYNMEKENLLACWKWTKLVNHQSQEMKRLFDDALNPNQDKYKTSLVGLLNEQSHPLCDCFRAAMKLALQRAVDSERWVIPPERSRSEYGEGAKVLRDKVFNLLQDRTSDRDSMMGFESCIAEIMGAEDAQGTPIETQNTLPVGEIELVNQVVHNDVFGEMAAAAFPKLKDFSWVRWLVNSASIDEDALSKEELGSASTSHQMPQ